jgi:hypothetical protein
MKYAYEHLFRFYVIRKDLVLMKRVKCVVSGSVVYYTNSMPTIPCRVAGTFDTNFGHHRTMNEHDTCSFTCLDYKNYTYLGRILSAMRLYKHVQSTKRRNKYLSEYTGRKKNAQPNLQKVNPQHYSLIL